MTQKEIYLKTEGNAWFQRNLKEGQKNENKGVVLFSDFYEHHKGEALSEAAKTSIQTIIKEVRKESCE